MNSLTLNPALVLIQVLAGITVLAMVAPRVAHKLRGKLRPAIATPLPTQSARQQTIPTPSVAVPAPDTQVRPPVEPATPAFTGPGESDVYLHTRCVCGAHQLVGNMLDQARVCLACERIIYVSRGRFTLVPIREWQRYSKVTDVQFGGVS